MTLTSINPTTGKIIAKFDEWNTETINKQLATSIGAFDCWKKTEYQERKTLLKNTALLLHSSKASYAKLMSTEMGKPIQQAEAEVDKCAWVCNFYAENGQDFLKSQVVGTDTEKSYVQFNPLGIILGIMPWNYPFWQVFRWAAPSLMAGNVAVLKHSSNVPQCASVIEDIFRESGLPNDVFKNIPISSQRIAELIQDERIAAISLTGSSAAGSSTARLAGSCIKKTVLELGGSDPFIVFNDANIDNASTVAVQARMMNTGQSCIAAKRFIVLKEVFDEFAEQLTKKIENLTVGNPLDPTTDIGPLARLDMVEQLEKQVRTSVEKGAAILTGGKRPGNTTGFFYLPTVLSNVKKGMSVYDEETFGPVAALIKVKDEKEALQVANDTCYGLGASIWTDDTKKAEQWSKHLQAGNVFINEMVKSDPRLPFGGIKQSGYGRELSQYGIKEFVNIQTVYIKEP